MGVPPQVMGKNINSERLASSNRLSEMAISSFQNRCDALRAHIAHVLEQVSSTEYSNTDLPAHAHIAFSNCLTAHQLTEVLPFLKIDAAVRFIQCAHNIPPWAVSRTNVSAIQQNLIGTKQNGSTGTRAEKRKGVPESVANADAAFKRAKASA